ncbi:MAG: hypothetical protein Q7S06_02655 [Nanoarchaeota archaeon]|nr:hypothetical protein [Nanoarchaeota archaeon]
MELNRTIIQILKRLKELDNENINKHLLVNEGSTTFKINQSEFLKINENNLLMNGKNIEEKILVKKPKNLNKINQFNQFIDEISDSIVRLNHIGINYSCRNIKDELKEYKKLIDKSNYKIYEEDSGNKNQRWFFIADLSNWQYPMFEIVLKETKTNSVNTWVPHFQIDIDTKLDFETLRKIANSKFKNEFFEWKLDIPNHGIVLAMGFISNIKGTKICLGVGTNLRDTKYQHSLNNLKEV